MICEFNNASVSIEGQEVLKQIQWSIPKGSVVGLLGKNGAGKSTLIRSLLGLIRTSDGSITTLGVEAIKIDDKEKAMLAYVPQTSVGYEGISVKRALQVHSACYPNWNQALANRMIEKFSIAEKQKVQKLSVGQRQLLMLIFALASKPSFLVMDEPVASLDPSARRDILQFITEACDEGCTILYSTHITGDIHRLADRVALLANGKIEFDHSCEMLDNTVSIRNFQDVSSILKKLSLLGFENKLLHHNENEVLVCDWNEDIEINFDETVVLQKLNLEELFIRWHKIQDQLNQLGFNANSSERIAS